MKQIHKCANEVSKFLLGMSSDVSFFLFLILRCVMVIINLLFGYKVLASPL